MVFDESKVKQIESFVYKRPRCISEIAELLRVSWRTADRYIDQLTERGRIGVHTFRAGSQGGLKVVYWINQDAAHSSKIYDLINKRIINSAAKSDFSPFDVYQHTEPGMRNAFSEVQHDKIFAHGTQDINNLLRKTRKEYLSFSGDFSWTQLNENGSEVLETLALLIDKNISIKMLGRIDFRSIQNVERVLALNKQAGRNAIEIRHTQQPLRGAIVDDVLLRLVEFNPSIDKKGDEVLYYEITDPDWVQNFKNIFWTLYQAGIPADKRISDIKSIQFIRKNS